MPGPCRRRRRRSILALRLRRRLHGAASQLINSTLGGASGDHCVQLYFDTSVYDDIAKAGVATAAAAAVRTARVRLTASSDNLLELFAISDPSARSEQLCTLTAVATNFDQTPSFFREAEEVAKALSRRSRNQTG